MPSQAPEITAILLNNTLLAIDLMTSGKDEYFSLKEFAIGAPLVNRSIDLCYGYAKVPPTTSTTAAFEAVVGQGITRITNNDVTAKLTRVNNSFTGINFTNLLPAGKVYENVYAFGNVFISQTESFLIDNPTATLTRNILKGETSGVPIFMAKDVDLDTVIQMARRNEIPEAECTEENFIKIFDVIIEIFFFDPNDIATKNVVLHFIDKRKPRGWGGFAEEFMGAYLTPQTINKSNDYNLVLKNINDNFYNLVNSWINLRSWSPSFIDFWQQAENNALMPDRLKEYLEIRFSILIWGQNGRN